MVKSKEWSPSPTTGYCHPICGLGCTKREYQKALTLAKVLADSLGPGWTGVVWDNLGWHSKARNEDAEVDVYIHDTHYWATTTNSPWQYCAHGKTPQEALQNMMVQLEEVCKLHLKLFKQLKDAFDAS